MEKLSVVIITLNEERNIERCLRSVQWVDEVVVVDALSSDRTVEICRKLKARVIQRAWDGFAPQKQFAVSSASHPWVFVLDADEEISPELGEELRTTLASENMADGYRVNRKSFFLGQWMRYGGWFPDAQIRLFRKTAGSVSQRPVHEGIDVQGRVGQLVNPLNHYTYHSIEQYLSKLNIYTSLDVSNKLLEKPHTVRWYNFLLNPISVFLRMYVALGGFRDGFRGFLLAAYSSLYKLLLYAKSWEYQTAAARKTVPPPVTTEALNPLR